MINRMIKPYGTGDLGPLGHAATLWSGHQMFYLATSGGLRHSVQRDTELQGVWSARSQQPFRHMRSECSRSSRGVLARSMRSPYRSATLSMAAKSGGPWAGISPATSWK
jgi:hypothetical protein